MNNRLRNLLCIVSATTFAVFALSATAASPQKTFSAFFGPDSALPTTGSPPQVTLTIKNESPPPLGANANASSFKVTIYGLTVLPNNMTCPGAFCNLDPLIPNTIAVSKITPPIKAQDLYQIKFYANSCGDASVVADPSATNPPPDITVWTGSQFTGSTFAYIKTGDAKLIKTSISCGQLACGGDPTSVPKFTADGNPPSGVITAKRSLYDKDGELCTPLTQVPYTVTNTITNAPAPPGAPKSNKVKWPAAQVSDAGYWAVFEYTVPWPSGGLQNGWNVAWKEPAGIPSYIPAPQCKGTALKSDPSSVTYLPARYGTLDQQSLGKNDTSVKIDTTQAVVLPPNPFTQFTIVIGTERLRVTAISNTGKTWTVLRRQDGTTTPPGSYPFGTSIASTPMQPVDDIGAPANADYEIGEPAQVCLQPHTTDGFDTFSDQVDGFQSPR